jgi:hypothetical protein
MGTDRAIDVQVDRAMMTIIIVMILMIPCCCYWKTENHSSHQYETRQETVFRNVVFTLKFVCRASSTLLLCTGVKLGL